MLKSPRLSIVFSGHKRPLRRSCALLGDRSGLALTEFALIFPIFVGFGMVGMEYTNVVLARQKTERVAATLADQVASNLVPPNERQVADLFSSVDRIAAPFAITDDGTVTLTAVIGIFDSNTNKVENKIAWQRCQAPGREPSSIGTQWTGTNIVDGRIVLLPGAILLAQNQMVIISEVTYNYKPLISFGILEMGGATNTLVRETAVYRTRGKAITDITPVAGVPEQSC